MFLFSLVCKPPKLEEANTTTLGTCADPAPYLGMTCRGELVGAWQGCVSSQDNEPVIYISSDVNQTDLESTIASLAPSTTPKCQRALRQLLCLHVFPLCVGTAEEGGGEGVWPTRERCVEMSTELCPIEWEAAIAAGYMLPTCAELPEETCTGEELTCTCMCVYMYI